VQLQPRGVRLRFLDVWEPYHVRSGEIHCGTNAIRRPAHPARWKSALTTW
jgi:protein-arginine deiminase